MLEGFAFFLFGLAALLSGIVRMLTLAQHKQLVTVRFGRAIDLCVLTGLDNKQSLQDSFGPATLDGVWPSVTLEEIDLNRRPLGHIVGRQWPNYFAVGICLLGPILGMIIGSDLVHLAILTAFALQIFGWAFTARLSNTL